MENQEYKLGIYFNKFDAHMQQFGIGLVWGAEKYIHFNLFHLELAIGYTS